MLRWILLISFLPILGLASGCGGDHGLAPVSGRVTLDGTPLADAAVLFQAEGGGVPATGVTDKEGNFEMSTGELKGVAIGKNSVSVVKEISLQPKGKVEESEIVPTKLLTPPKYASPQTSGLSVDVKPGMESVMLELVSGKKKS